MVKSAAAGSLSLQNQIVVEIQGDDEVATAAGGEDEGADDLRDYYSSLKKANEEDNQEESVVVLDTGYYSLISTNEIGMRLLMNLVMKKSLKKSNNVFIFSQLFSQLFSQHNYTSRNWSTKVLDFEPGYMTLGHNTINLKILLNSLIRNETSD